MSWTWLRDFLYPLLVLGLFIVPRALQRFRIPSAITCIALGALLGMTGVGDLRADPAVPLLSTLGIVSLFAGLEVNV
jgi:Kef-type K+ transport system membrane component KefB